MVARAMAALGGGYRLVSCRGHAWVVRQADSYAVGLQQLPQGDWERAVASLSAALEQAADSEKDEIFRFIESGEMSRCQQGMTQKTPTWLSADEISGVILYRDDNIIYYGTVVDGQLCLWMAC